MSDDNFSTAAQTYWDAGWRGILPVLPATKRPVVSGRHGKTAPNVSEQELRLWKDIYGSYGIALRLWEAGEGSEREVIGIDVDHYDDKKGYDTLIALEEELGKLPPTWISTARSDIRSGIRFFCVPAGLEFHDIGGDIDIVARGMRYAAVWPTVHPGVGSSYLWHTPQGQAETLGVVPGPMDFPDLPPAWVDRLTQGGKKFHSLKSDNLSTTNEIIQWAFDTLPLWDGQPCPEIEKRLKFYIGELSDCLEHHDAARKAIWNLISVAFEGHCGGMTALEDYMNFWVEDAGRRGKRDLSEAMRELGNSYTGALRKKKAESDNLVAAGHGALKGVPCNGTCSDNVIPIFTQFSNVIHPFLKPPDEYDTTDDGNADHLVDAFMTSEGSSIRYVTDRKMWIFWDGEKWNWDNEEGGMIRRCWWRVRDYQKALVDQLKSIHDQEIARVLAIDPQAIVRGSSQSVDSAIIEARSEWQRWAKHTEKSGNNFHADNAIKNASKRDGVTITTEELDDDDNLLGVGNGILELRMDGVFLRQPKMTDMVTLNTDVELLDHSELKNSIGLKLWNDFLDTFIPDREWRKIIQTAMGYSLLGGNHERVFLIAYGPTSSGKSTFARLCGKAIGEYAAPVGKTMFQGHKFKPSLRLKKNKRLLTNTEFDNNTVVSTAVFKEISGGSDELEVERKGVDVIDDINIKFTPFIATNEMFKLSDPDQAIERRIYPLQFAESIMKSEMKADYGQKLELHSKEAVLRWLVDGYIMYRKNGGLIENEKTSKGRQFLMGEIDEFSIFMKECILKHDSHDDRHMLMRWSQIPDWCFPGPDLYNVFSNWWYASAFPGPPVSKPAFTKRMKALGLTKKQIRPQGGESREYWLGIKVIRPETKGVFGIVQTEKENPNSP